MKHAGLLKKWQTLKASEGTEIPPLIKYAFFNHASACATEIDKNPKAIEAHAELEGRKNLNALHIAALQKSIQVCRVLSVQSSKLLLEKDEKGLLPIQYAMESGDLTICTIFAKYMNLAAFAKNRPQTKASSRTKNKIKSTDKSEVSGYELIKWAIRQEKFVELAKVIEHGPHFLPEADFESFIKDFLINKGILSPNLEGILKVYEAGLRIYNGSYLLVIKEQKYENGSIKKQVIDKTLSALIARNILTRGDLEGRIEAKKNKQVANIKFNVKEGICTVTDHPFGKDALKYNIGTMFTGIAAEGNLHLLIEGGIISRKEALKRLIRVKEAGGESPELNRIIEEIQETEKIIKEFEDKVLTKFLQTPDLPAEVREEVTQNGIKNVDRKIIIEVLSKSSELRKALEKDSIQAFLSSYENERYLKVIDISVAAMAKPVITVQQVKSWLAVRNGGPTMSNPDLQQSAPPVEKAPLAASISKGIGGQSSASPLPLLPDVDYSRQLHSLTQAMSRKKHSTEGSSFSAVSSASNPDITMEASSSAAELIASASSEGSDIGQDIKELIDRLLAQQTADQESAALPMVTVKQTLEDRFCMNDMVIEDYNPSSSMPGDTLPQSLPADPQDLHA
jgi:hypothetical protein